LGNIGSQLVQFINKATIVLTLYFGAKAAIAGDMTVGELVAFNMLAARVAQYRAAAAGLSADPDFGRATGRYPEHPARAGAREEMPLRKSRR
jgi:hypothetical protein